MKFQTSGVLGTSYAIAKLAPKRVSGLYANQVSGEVRAVLGKNLRSGNIWETVELPRLKQNKNVTKIFTIDPETKIETLLWTR